MTIRVRFAPSPTGHLHVGGARTALFNWLLARRAGGTFVLRIEDTDAERSSEAMTAGILDAMRWMGLDWDEGPFRQSERLERYRALAADLVERGHAYRCFCSPEDMAVPGQGPDAKAEWRYDRTCLGMDSSHIRRRLDAGDPYAVRFQVPPGVVRFEDAVFGNLEKAGEELEDFVIVRATGQPTYQLGVVADDLDMRISHVVRGADHIANTPKQILLYRALGATPPRFAHVPLILGPDRSRLSKRHGATSVLAYRDEGIPAEAFVNFLALLGWSDGTDREMFAPEDLADVFSLDGVQRSDAVFDPDKLSWFSGQYINALPVEALLVRLKPFMEARGVWEDRFGEGSGREWLTGVVALIRPRYRSLVTLAAEIATYSGDDVDFEDAAIEKFLKDPNLKDYLPRLAERLEMLESYDARTTEDALRALADELGVKAGLLINASRVALTGKAVAPSMFDVMAAVGQTRTVRRLREAVGRVPAVPTDAPEPGRASV